MIEYGRNRLILQIKVYLKKLIFYLTQALLKVYTMEIEKNDFFKQVSDKLEKHNELSNKKEEEEVSGTNTPPIKQDKDTIVLDSGFSCDTCDYTTNKSNNLKRHKARQHASIKTKVDGKKMVKVVKRVGHHAVEKIDQMIKSKKVLAKNLKKNVKKLRAKESKSKIEEDRVDTELEGTNNYSYVILMI